jgi:predicted homoserine dehydrogenase-like protein
MLDGEGGYTVFGKLFPARKSLALGSLPLGLAHKLKLVRPVAKDQSLTWADVAVDESLSAYKLRKEMETLFAKA